MSDSSRRSSRPDNSADNERILQVAVGDSNAQRVRAQMHRHPILQSLRHLDRFRYAPAHQSDRRVAHDLPLQAASGERGSATRGVAQRPSSEASEPA